MLACVVTVLLVSFLLCDDGTKPRDGSTVQGPGTALHDMLLGSLSGEENSGKHAFLV